MFDESKERYKSMQLSHRLLIMAVLGLVPIGYMYYEEGSNLTQKLEVAQKAKLAEEKKFQVAKKRKEELPLLEEKFVTVTEELQKAQEKLPSKFHMDDILHNTASVAKEIGVEIASFKPGEERAVEGASRYMELPVSLTLMGKYSQVASFFDSIVNLEVIVHLRNISLSAQRQKKDEGYTGSSVLIDAKVDLVLFRSM